ncbi:zinc finger bed domain-containing protein ricesleeper 2-like [Gigaspora margarita]|uniref:Zinc finger bed domain-containing protein ricesleeper 2-like n=1 Tax=Gigaspora margarita TaxID=4874 RepID=A0A8H4EPZ6_GIGMA|nr:zinc finger bed domain-containing protein ricesleeper 2-like [Gigaspora margarita]
MEELTSNALGETSTTSTTNTSELDRYFISEPVEEDTDPLDWWKVNKRTYPILSKLASDYLSVQATSIACEQAFSLASNTISKTRNRLHSKTSRACLCIKSWISSGVGEI